MPTGVIRSDNPGGHVLEAHIEVGKIRQLESVDGAPELGWAAVCVADDPSTVTCTDNGHRVVFAWSGAAHRLKFTVVDGLTDERRVPEGAPWIRVS
jgi:hypothetical protein